MLNLARKFAAGAALSAIVGLAATGFAAADSKLLNVSYDPTRELYKAYDAAFAKHWKDTTGEDISIEVSNGGSGAQARKVIDGLEADVVTLALASDIDAIAAKGSIDPKWQSRLPNNSTPYTSTIVFLVRKGNPKGIKDWGDLVKGDVQVITPNPKTSGGARWAYLAAWGWALKQPGGNEDKAKTFVADIYSKHVPVLDTGARGSTTTFVQRGIGDVLLSWENEAYLALKELGPDKFEIVTPSLSILAEPPVAVVDKVVDAHGTRKQAEEYVKYLYSPEAQEIEAQNFYRPTDQAVAEKYKASFPQIPLFNLSEIGTWTEVQKKHFADGGVFDQIYQPQ
jgi:sulfate transport system substrate-binding protein